MHVLEHLESPEAFLRSILDAAYDIGVRSLFFAVPGDRGFRSDATHLTFVDSALFDRVMRGDERWKIRTKRYFPVPFRSASEFLTHNELQVMIERVAHDRSS
jgi:hypothetical protein